MSIWSSSLRALRAVEDAVLRLIGIGVLLVVVVAAIIAVGVCLLVRGAMRWMDDGRPGVDSW